MKKSSQKKSASERAYETERGSVTIFFVIIFLCIIMLTGSMIDLSRIMVADNKLDSAIRASTKSLMAEYNEDLIGSYGIFANQTEEKKQVFFDYLSKNLELSSNGFMDYEILENTAKVMGDDNRTLANDEVLQGQINAYMEAKAPINTGVRAAIRASNVIQSVLNSKYSQDLTKKKESDIDRLLNKNKSYALTTQIGDISKDTPRELSKDVDHLEEELDIIIHNNKQMVVDLKNGVLSDLAGGSDEFDEMKTVSSDKSALIKFASVEIKKMESYATDILNLKDALEAEYAKEKPNYERIKRLNQQLRQKEESYEDAQRQIELKIDALEAGESYPMHKRLDWNTFNQWKGNDKINVTIPGLEANPVTENHDISTVSNGKKLITFQENTRHMAKGLELPRVGDKYILVEYVMDRYTYATTGTEREQSQFKYGEIEYILNGDDNQGINLLLTFGKIFLFCYTINVLDLCLQGVPLWPVALIGALAYTANSMYTIYSGERYVPFNLLLSKGGWNSAKEVVGLGYSDLLYIQLFFANEADLLSRVRRLLMANINGGTLNDSSIRASDLYTKVNTEVQVSVNLLFLPMLPLNNFHVNGFQNGRYVITKRHSFEY